MDISSLSITLPIALTIVGTFIGVMTYLGNKKKSHKEDEARLVRIETMLVNIENNTSNLNQRVSDHDKLLTKHETRLSVIEEKISHHKGANK